MARIGKLSWALLVLFSLANTARAGVLTGELDNSQGSLEDQFIYTLSIQGSFDSDPEFPKVDGLEARAAGKSQNISIVNGKYSREVQIQYVLSPQKDGSFIIPAIRVKVDGEDMETLPLELKVSAAASPRTDPAAGAQDQDAGASSGLFIERSFSKTTAYVGEAIGVSVKVFNRIKVVGAQPDIKYPSAFQVKNVEGQKSYTEMVNGQEYNVTELEAVLVANREGEFTIDPALLIAQVAVNRGRRNRGFFDDLLGGTELSEKRLRSSPAVLKVLALPIAGRRKDFSGLVGKFSLTGDLSPRSGIVGDTMNLSLVVLGQGSSSGMLEPQLPFDSKVGKVYKDQADYKENLDGKRGIESSKTFKYAIVPSTAGSFQLGAVKVQTFNPETASYQDLSFDLGAIEVLGAGSQDERSSVPPIKSLVAPQSSSLKTEQKPVEALAKDLVEPHSQKQLSGSNTLNRSDWVNGSIALAISLTLIVISLVKHWRRRFSGEASQLQIAHKAFRHSKKQLDFAQQCLKRQDLAQALRAAQNCFKEYTGAKFGVIGSAVTLRDIETHMRSRSVSRETLLELREVWSALDQMIYAPPLGQNPTRGEELLNKSRKILEQMERQCSRSSVS